MRNIHKLMLLLVVFLMINFDLQAKESGPPQKPNVLFIIVDDLNDWLSCMNGHPQAFTPNIDRLAARGLLFTNAHCQAPLCGPSRTSLFFGMRPSSSGVYANFPKEYKKISTLQNIESMPAYFGACGYDTLATGKIFHNGYEPNPNQTEFQIAGPYDTGKIPFGPYPPNKLHVFDTFGGNLAAYDWGFPYNSDEETLDHAFTTWAIEQIRKPREKPFFLGVGLIKTHFPHFASKNYQKQYPLEKIQLPPILETDLDDVPEFGRAINRAPATPTYNWIKANNALPEMVQAYLACVTMVDKQVGRLLDALDSSGKSESTIVVFTADNGFHRGEKQQVEKWTLWNRSTRVPLIIASPIGKRGLECQQPVELLDIYPTLVDLCGLSMNPSLEGTSLRNELQDPHQKRDRPAITTWYPNNHSVQTTLWHYIRYADGTEELYDKKNDPNEWNNLAGTEPARPVVSELIRWLPTSRLPVPGSDYNAVPQVVRNRSDWIKE